MDKVYKSRNVGTSEDVTLNRLEELTAEIAHIWRAPKHFLAMGGTMGETRAKLKALRHTADIVEKDLTNLLEQKQRDWGRIL